MSIYSWHCFTVSVFLHDYLQMNLRFCALGYWLHIIVDSTWTRYISSFFYHKNLAEQKSRCFCINWFTTNESVLSTQREISMRKTSRLNSVQCRFRNYCALLKQHSVALTYIWQADVQTDYKKVQDAFKAHFVPKCNVIYECAIFPSRSQREGESTKNLSALQTGPIYWFW